MTTFYVLNFSWQDKNCDLRTGNVQYVRRLEILLNFIGKFCFESFEGSGKMFKNVNELHGGKKDFFS